MTRLITETPVTEEEIRKLQKWLNDPSPVQVVMAKRQEKTPAQIKTREEILEHGLTPSYLQGLSGDEIDQLTAADLLSNGWRWSGTTYTRHYAPRRPRIVDEDRPINCAGGYRKGYCYIIKPNWGSTTYSFRRYLKYVG